MSAALLMPTEREYLCCCYQGTGTNGRHCAACHANSHTSRWLYVVIEPATAQPRIYDDQEAAETYARAAGAVVAGLPLVADYRTPDAPPVSPAVGVARPHLAAVPDAEPRGTWEQFYAGVETPEQVIAKWADTVEELLPADRDAIVGALPLNIRRGVVALLDERATAGEPTRPELVRPYVGQQTGCTDECQERHTYMLGCQLQRAMPDPGPTDEQVMSWNEHNDHAAGADELLADERAELEDVDDGPGGYPISPARSGGERDYLRETV